MLIPIFLAFLVTIYVIASCTIILYRPQNYHYSSAVLNLDKYYTNLFYACVNLTHLYKKFKPYNLSLSFNESYLRSITDNLVDCRAILHDKYITNEARISAIKKYPDYAALLLDMTNHLVHS